MIPDEDPTVATPGEPLVHVPPEIESVQVTAPLAHTVATPYIGGIGLTVM